jgi:hypothetical protein
MTFIIKKQSFYCELSGFLTFAAPFRRAGNVKICLSSRVPQLRHFAYVSKAARSSVRNSTKPVSVAERKFSSELGGFRIGCAKS